LPYALPLTVAVIFEAQFLCASHQRPTYIQMPLCGLTHRKSFVQDLAERVVWRSIRTFRTEGCSRGGMASMVEQKFPHSLR